jgi:hypothetical protein
MSNNKNLKYKVFVSYSRKDKDLVHSFIGLGDNREFEIWIDEAEKKPGSDWRNTIRENINSSDGAILFISNNALDENSPIKSEEIPLLIKRNNDPQDNFQFFPVFLDYVDEEIVKNYQFIKEGTNESVNLFDRYDIWNIEANNKNELENEMPSEMSDFKRNSFWADLNLNITKALEGKKISKIGTPSYWNSNKEKLKKEKARRRKRYITNVFSLMLTVAVLSLLYLQFRPQEEPQTSDVFNIGGTVQLGALTVGDCFNILNQEEELSWNSYVQYRACDLLHDGEVFYRENQLDFASNNVSYSGLLGLFSNTCNEQVSKFTKSSLLPSAYSIEFYWDIDSQALATKPFDMLCLTISEEKSSGSYVEDVTGVRILLPNPGDKYDCENFNSVLDAQTWYELYFSDYGDIANLDINDNGVACDELIEDPSAQGSSDVSMTTSSTTLPPSTTTTRILNADTQSYNQDGVTDTMYYEPEFYQSINSWLNGDYKKSIDTYINDQQLEIVNFWEGVIEVQIPTPVLIAGPWASKVVLNGEELGIESPFSYSYNYGINYQIGNIRENQDYKLEIFIVDALLREHGPMILEFNGSNWNKDDNYCCYGDLITSSSGKYLYYFSDNQYLSKPIISSFTSEIRNVSSNYFELLLDIEYQPEDGFTGFSIGYFGMVDEEIVLWGAGTSPVINVHKLNISKITDKEIKIYVYHQMVKWADPIALTITDEMLNN